MRRGLISLLFRSQGGVGERARKFAKLIFSERDGSVFLDSAILRILVILLLGGLELAGAKGSHFEGWERMVMVLTAGSA